MNSDDYEQYLPTEPPPSYFEAVSSTPGLASNFTSGSTYVYQPHSNLPPTSSTSRLFALGGKTANHEERFSISEYNPSSLGWKSKFSSSPNRHSFGATSIGSKIFIVGGVEQGLLKDDFDMYDCKRNTFRKLSKLPNYRKGCSAAALGGSVFVSGGADHSANPLETAHVMLRFNVVQNRWFEMKSMHKPRYEHTMLAHQNRLYAIGGHHIGNFIEEFHPDRNKWVKIQSWTRAMRTVSATVHDGEIYACSKRAFEMLELDSPTPLKLPLPPNVRTNSLVSYKGKLLAIGGCLSNSKAPTDFVHQFDPRNRRWIRQPDMGTARKRHCTVVAEY